MRGRKIIFVLIFTSNHFCPRKIEERERETTRKRDRTSTPAPAKARSIHIQELRRTQKTQDRTHSSSNSQRERESERRKDSNTQTQRKREREKYRAVESIPQIANPKIVKPIHHRSSRTQKSSNPFTTDHCEPRNCHTICQTHSSNPRSSRWIVDLLALGQSCCRSACSRLSLIFLLLLWWRGWFLFCCSLILGWSLIWWIFFVRYWEFGFYWIWWYICLEAEKMWEIW